MTHDEADQALYWLLDAIAHAQEAIEQHPSAAADNRQEVLQAMNELRDMLTEAK